MEVSIRGCKIQVQDLNRPQEFKISYKSTEIEQKASLIEIISVKIQFYFEICARNKDGKSKCT